MPDGSQLDLIAYRGTKAAISGMHKQCKAEKFDAMPVDEFEKKVLQDKVVDLFE